MRNMIGHVCEDSSMSVCGFVGQRQILVQTESCGVMKQLSLYESRKGVFFNTKGKRIYLKYLKSL